MTNASNENKINPEAKGIINNYMQKGLLKAIEYPTSSEGPPHAPTFTMYGEAVLPNNDSVVGETVVGQSKKKAQAAAATNLLQALHNFAPFMESMERLEKNKELLTQQQAPVKSLDEITEILRGYDCKHHAKLPYNYLKHLAKQVQKHNTVDQEDWILGFLEQYHKEWEEEKEQTAMIEGYHPFVQLNLNVYKNLQKDCGDWVLEMMKKYLDDPKKVFPKWAAQCAVALAEIGEEECKKHTDSLYKFVTNHEAWEKNSNARDKYC